MTTTMRGKASFDWQVKEEPTEHPPLPLEQLPPQGVSAQRWLWLLAAALLMLTTAYWGTQRLVQRAEANLQQVETEIVEAVNTELANAELASTEDGENRRRVIPETRMAGLPGPDDFDVADLTGTRLNIIDLQDSLALVELRMLPDAPWHTTPYRVGRVMRERGGGWTTTTPVGDFWQDPQTYTTDFFQLEFGKRNAAVVAEVAPELDARYLRLHRDLGLSAPQPGDRLTIQIKVISGDDLEVTDIRYSSTILIVPPPELLPRPEGMRLADTLRQAIDFPLAVKVFDTAQANYPVHCDWYAIQEGIGLWLRWEEQTLPSRRQWQMQDQIQRWLPQEGLPRLDDLIAIPQDCWHRPPYLEMDLPIDGRYIPRADLAATLIQSIVAVQGRESIPLLWRGFRQFKDWESLAQEVLGISAAQLETQWQRHLQPSPLSNPAGP